MHRVNFCTKKGNELLELKFQYDLLSEGIIVDPYNNAVFPSGIFERKFKKENTV